MLRNLLTTLRRFKLASTLNIIGLAVAFATFTVIMMQVTYEMSYGKDDPNYKEIYRVESKSYFSQGKWTSQIIAPIIKYLENDEPRVKDIYYADNGGDVEVAGSDTSNMWVKTQGYWNYVKPNTVFEFEMIEGSMEQMPLQGNAIIPKSLADILYPNQSAVGKNLSLRGRYHREGNQIVVGVYKDFPENSLLRNNIFGGMPKGRSKPESGIAFDATKVFIRCAPADTANIMQGIRNYCAHSKNDYGSDFDETRLTPAGEVYFASDFSGYGENEPGNRSTTALLLGISILIIVIASINFINFSTALAPVRIVGLNTRHVFGKTKTALRGMLIFEATAIAAIAYGLALLVVHGFAATPYASLIRAHSVALQDNLTLLWIIGGGALMVGFLAGLYPAIYCTRFDVATTLKGSGMGSRSGQWMRMTLIGFQYVISIGLIIGALFIAEQNRFLTSSPLGFDKDNVLNINAPSSSHNQRLRMVTKLMENPEFTDYTMTWGVLGEGFGAGTTVPINGDTINFKYMPVLHNFNKFFKIPIIAGRDFTESDYTIKFPDNTGFYYDPNPQIRKAIFNRKAQQMYNIQVDSVYGSYVQCIGICDNVNSTSLYNEIQPTFYCLDGLLGEIYLRYEGDDLAKGYDLAQAAFKEAMGPEEHFDCTILENAINEAYAKEQDLSKIITLLSFVAIILSLVGVFGLVVFENQYRRKEIGIRKVFGSRTTQILMLFNRKFIIICAIAFAIASPIVFYLVHQWLTGFAYSTPIHWWIFIVGLLIVGLLTVVTVTVQSYRSATENPTKSIRN